MYTSPLNFVCGLMLPGLASTWPRSTSSFSTPRSSTPMLSPATPESSSLRNISTPVTTFFSVGLKPTISTSSPTFTCPRSTRPVTTLQRPERRHPHHRHVVSLEAVGRQQLPHFELHQVQQLRVVHRVHLVERHH